MPSTNAALAAKLAAAIGRIVCICGRTASDGTVAARVITPIMDMVGGIHADRDTGGPALRGARMGSRYQGNRTPPAAVGFGRIVLNMQML